MNPGNTVSAFPPFEGSIWYEPGIIIDSDPSIFDTLFYRGQENRQMFDRRINRWQMFFAHVFEASYERGKTIDIRVNPEFSLEEAEAYALEYAYYLGQIPAFLMEDVRTVSIHDGLESFGGGSNDLLVHVLQGEVYLKFGNMIETLIHEAAHVSLDEEIYADPAWKEAVEADPTFISTYAKDHPNREDVAESILLYLAATCKADRISESMLNKISTAMPNRIQYFAAQQYDLYPLER
ncbi:MAG: hypothetical protein AAGC85_01840 [Bacteroidota bacterium]